MTETFIMFRDRTEDEFAPFPARAAVEPARRRSMLDARLVGGLLGLLPVTLLWLSGTSCIDAMPFTPQLCAVEADARGIGRIASADGAHLPPAPIAASATPAAGTVQL